MDINYRDGIYTLDTFLEAILAKIDGLEISHAKNWITLCEVSSMVAAISDTVKNEEKLHNERVERLLDRIKELKSRTRFIADGDADQRPEGEAGLVLDDPEPSVVEHAED